MAYQNNGHVGADHAARTQCLEFSPTRKMKKWNNRWWAMIDENADYVIKSKLTITVKRLCDLYSSSKGSEFDSGCYLCAEVSSLQ